MDISTALRSALVAALGLAAWPAAAKVVRIDPCADAAEIRLHEPGRPDLSWTYCGDGDLGSPDVDAPWDEREAEAARVASASAMRTAATLGVSIALADGRRFEAEGLAVDAAPRVVAGAGADATTVQALRALANYISIEVEDEPARAIATAVAEAEKIQVDHIERLAATTPLTLRFRVISTGTALQLVAEESGTLLLVGRRGGHYAISTPEQAEAVKQAAAAVDAARGADDTAALEAALVRLVATAPVPANGPTVDVGPELDELARLAAQRGDYPAAERLQRRRLALIERLDGSRATRDGLDALAQVAALRLQQDDRKGSAALFREVLEIGERVPDRDEDVMAQAWEAVGLEAMFAGDDREAERLLAKAVAATRDHPADSIEAVRWSSTLFAHAATLENLERWDESEAQLRRHLELMEAIYGKGDSATAATFEAMGRVAMQRDDMPRARRVFDQALAARGKGERAAWVREQVALLDALGPYVEREPPPGAADTLRRQLAEKPLPPAQLSDLGYHLDRRATAQRAARSPALATTCDGIAVVVAARTKAGGEADEALIARTADASKRMCLGGRP